MDNDVMSAAEAAEWLRGWDHTRRMAAAGLMRLDGPERAVREAMARACRSVMALHEATAERERDAFRRGAAAMQAACVAKCEG